MRRTITRNGVSVTINVERLVELRKALSSGMRIRVGILGSKANRKETVQIKRGPRKGLNKAGKNPSNLTNADIGLVHEKGSPSRKIPRRSFLEMPMTTFALPLMRIKNELWAMVQAGTMSMKKAYKALGVVAEERIQEGFDSGGFGKWPKPKYRQGSPLIDTAQLRKSISSMVVEGKK